MKNKINPAGRHVKILQDQHFPSPIVQKDISLRPFPYPFKAGMSICSDIDNTSPELFDTLHQFLNTNQQTPTGLGLNLEIGDSFWFFSNNHQVMGLANTLDTLTWSSERITQLNKAGWLDSLHTFGDFNNKPPFSRKIAKSVNNVFKELNIKVPVWINHGNVNNKHNLWGRIISSCAGDLPGSPFYHYDLTRKSGIKYYWWSEITPFPLSCATMQKTQLYLRRLDVWMKNGVKMLMGNSQKIRDPRQPFELALPVQLRDGHKIWGFTRYNRNPAGVWGRPGRHTLKYQLTEKFLEQLTAWQGYCILYTHFGQPTWKRNTPLFDDENLTALNRLVEKNKAGEIWLTLTSRLLRYWVTRHHLIWNVDKQGERNKIIIQQINDPVDGSREPSIEDLRGITFRTPNLNHTDIYIKNKKMIIKKWPETCPGGCSGFVGFVHPELDKSLFNKK